MFSRRGLHRPAWGELCWCGGQRWFPQDRDAGPSGWDPVLCGCSHAAQPWSSQVHFFPDFPRLGKLPPRALLEVGDLACGREEGSPLQCQHCLDHRAEFPGGWAGSHRAREPLRLLQSETRPSASSACLSLDGVVCPQGSPSQTQSWVLPGPARRAPIHAHTKLSPRRRV